jgi:HSP20 family protein
MYPSLLNFPGGMFSDIDRVRRDMDALFGLASSAQGIRSVADGGYPPMNVGHTAQSVNVFVFAPGIDASKVDVTLDRGVLTIAGERASDLPAESGTDSNVYGQERFTGKFRRAVSLPDDIDPSQVSATYRDGVLKVSVARREAVQARRISVA